MSNHSNRSQLIALQEPASASMEQNCRSLQPGLSVSNILSSGADTKCPSSKSSPISTKFTLNSLLDGMLEGDGSGDAHAVLVDHPYARITTRMAMPLRTRRSWNHALEKLIFSPNELIGSSAPSRRATYFASLEAHTDRLHEQLLELGYYPVAFSALEPFRGLSMPLAKAMIAGLRHDLNKAEVRLLEIRRANDSLRKARARRSSEPGFQSIDQKLQDHA